MPAEMAGKSALYGALFGLLPIGWIVLNVIFMYQLTNDGRAVRRAAEEHHRHHDRPPAAAAAGRVLLRRVLRRRRRLRHAGRRHRGDHDGTRLQAARRRGLSLIANTAPVAYGALGTPIVVLAAVTGLDLQALSAMVGRQLPFFSVLVPFWLIWAFVGFRRMLEIWPAILVAGVSFAIPQFLVSNYHGPWLVDVIAAICSMGALDAVPQDLASEAGVDQHVARRRRPCRYAEAEAGAVRHGFTRAQVIKAWTPWVILSVLVFLWGLPQIKDFLNDDIGAQVPDRRLAQPGGARAAGGAEADAGSRRLRAQLAVGHRHRHPDRRDHRRPGDGHLGPEAGADLRQDAEAASAISLLTIAAMLALGFTTKGAGLDSTLGLAFAHAGWFYPFFGAMLGWLGVALTGSDTSSNVLFGGLAEGLGRAARPLAGADGGGQQLGRRHGQDDRRAEHRRRVDRDAVVRPRRRHPALRVLPQPRAGRADGAADHGAGVRLAVHGAGRALIATLAADAGIDAAIALSRVRAHARAAVRRAAIASWRRRSSRPIG